MYLQQFYLGCLSHASYLVGSGGIAAVIDPQRDVGICIEDAARHGFEIQHVIETHLHADFVSGHRELAALTGARIYLGAQAGAKFPHVPLRDGDELRFGDCGLRFLETPGTRRRPSRSSRPISSDRPTRTRSSRATRYSS